MNYFDKSIIDFLNSFSRKSWAVDHALVFLSGSPVFKSWLIVSFLVWHWFHPAKDTDEKRAMILATISSTIAALIFVKVLRFFLPFRIRPLHNSELSFNLPYDVNIHALYEWSSFPSDNATMFFTLSASLFYISKKVGVIASIYSFFMVCLPRVYLGFHYPTDILAGAAIGGLFGFIGGLPPIKRVFTYYSIFWMHRNKGVFYLFLFFSFIEIANVFEDVRSILVFLHEEVHFFVGNNELASSPR